MSGFKRATAQERESEARKRTVSGIGYVSSDIPIFKPVDGDNQIRIVPPLANDADASLWGLEVWTYFINNRSWLSSKTFDSQAEDPIMSHFFDIREDNPEESQKFKGNKRYLMFLLDLNHDEPELKLWAAPPTLVDEFLGLAKNRRTGELIALEDPDEGCIIYFTKTGQGIGTRYTGIELDKEPYTLDDDLAEELELFSDMLIVPSSKELQKVLEVAMNGGNDEDDDDEEETPKRRSRPAPVKRRTMAKKADVEEEDDDSDEDDAKEEEEEKPSRKKSISALRKRVKDKVARKDYVY